MAPSTPSGPPTQVIAGDSWRWKDPDLSDYPQSEGWSLKYELLGVSQTLTITPEFQTSGDDENSWLSTVATDESDALDSGLYTLILRVVGSGDYDGREETVDIGIGRAVRADATPWRVSVAQNPRTAGAGDYELWAQETIKVIEARLSDRLTKDMESYSIGGRSITKIPVNELMNLRVRLYEELGLQASGSFGLDVEAVFNRV